MEPNLEGEVERPTPETQAQQYLDAVPIVPSFVICPYFQRFGKGLAGGGWQQTNGYEPQKRTQKVLQKYVSPFS